MFYVSPLTPVARNLGPDWKQQHFSLNSDGFFIVLSLVEEGLLGTDLWSAENSGIFLEVIKLSQPNPNMQKSPG